MKRIMSALSLSTLLLGTTSALADHQYAYRDDWALVTRVEPIVRTIEVPVQEEVCWNEEGRRHRPISSSGYVTGSTIMGGIVGGVIGSQMGRGPGRPFATAAGALVGASIGYTGSSAYSEGPIYVSHTQRCRTITSYRTEKRTDGYRIEYRYNGQEYQTTLSYRPTSREIRVRVSVLPVAE